MSKLDQTELERALRDREVGATRVVGVRVTDGEDSAGEPAVFLELTLANPRGEAGTWPVEDIWALRRQVRDVVSELESDVAWFITLAPEDAGELEPEDTDEQVLV